VLQSGIHAQKPRVNFHYLGHSSFLIFFDNGLSVLTDYGKPNAWLEYGWDSPISDIGDFQPTILTYSHTHDDHYDSTRIPDKTKYILKSADSLILADLTVTPILTSEDDLTNKSNTSYLFNYKGISILHLGDCQANIMNIDSIDNQKYIKNNLPTDCDIVLMPVEGKSKFIPQTEKFIDLIKPKTLIPMHYWSDKYKSEFLDYLVRENTDSNKKYKIINSNESFFEYHKSADTDSILIIDIFPSNFRSGK
jgi:L-ascorbate metabolism protein UlaG (beta-lactamase superfamily)